MAIVHPGLLAELDQDISNIKFVILECIVPEVKKSILNNEDSSLIIAEVAGALKDSVNEFHMAALAATAIALIAERGIDDENSDT